MKARNVRNPELAAAMAVHETTVSKWRSGAQQPDGDAIMRMAAVLQVSSGWLWSGQGDSGLGEPLRVAEKGAADYPARVWQGLPQRGRVFVQRFLLELTEAGATDDDVAAARELLTKPEVFTLHHGGRATEASDEEILQVMEASARFIRDTLRERGLKL
jgi:transcriptional regulator with XRE-family HTH domain